MHVHTHEQTEKNPMKIEEEVIWKGEGIKRAISRYRNKLETVRNEYDQGTLCACRKYHKSITIYK